MNEPVLSAFAEPVWEFIVDELDARGWDTDDLLERMSGDLQVNTATLLLLSAQKDIPNAYMGWRTAKALSDAFGISPEFFVNLDKTFGRAAGRTWAENYPEKPGPQTANEG